MSKKTVLFEIIQLSISMKFKCKYGFNCQKTFLFQAIQFYSNHFSISMLVVLFKPIDRGPIRCYHCGPEWDLGAMAMKGYSAFPKTPAMLETSPSDCLLSYPGHSLGGVSYSSAEKAVSVFYSPNWLGKGRWWKCYCLCRSQDINKWELTIRVVFLRKNPFFSLFSWRQLPWYEKLSHKISLLVNGVKEALVIYWSSFLLDDCRVKTAWNHWSQIKHPCY